MLSYQMEKDTIDGKKTIIQNPTEKQRLEHEKVFYHCKEMLNKYYLKNKKIKSVEKTGGGLGTGAIIGLSIGGIILLGGISYLIYHFTSSDSSGGG